MRKEIKITLLAVIIAGLFTACENGKWDFPDFEYSAVYFAYQTPIRTIVLGEDIFDTSLDNEYKCQIMATMGGVYSNKNDVEIGIRVDNSLCDNLMFEETEGDIVSMPSNYYTLSSDKIVIEKGKILGGVTVQLSDAFFEDAKSLETTYVIPVRMTNVENADSILSGDPLVDDPRRGVSADWDVEPKDYILYAVKYINKYDANYLRRGKDVISGASEGVINRHTEEVENNEVINTISTRSLSTIAWEHQTRDMDNFARTSTLLLTFDNNSKCSVSSDTPGVTVSGSGEFVSKGDKNSWGEEDRDVIYLEYSIDYGDTQFAITDTLVVRDRGVKPEWFTSVLK